MVQHPNQLYKVYRAKWFMALYGGLTPKPQYAYCNSCHIAKLNLGRMVGWLKSKSANGKRVATCKTYLNSKGDKCFKGTPALRKSEYLAGKLFTVYFFQFQNFRIRFQSPNTIVMTKSYFIMRVFFLWLAVSPKCGPISHPQPIPLNPEGVSNEVRLEDRGPVPHPDYKREGPGTMSC